MSQYQSPFEQETMERPKTSGLAIASLVCSILFCTAIVGLILGLIAIPAIGSNPARKGKGLATAGIVISLIFLIAQYFLVTQVVVPGYTIIKEYIAFVMSGPDDALSSGASGDVAGFKQWFVGPGATASDEEAQAFLDELANRYGAFVSASFDDQSGQPPTGRPGQPRVPFPYILTFDTGTVSAEAELVFADEMTGDMLKKFGYITVFDAERGDLTYPPGEAGADPAADETEGESTGEDEG
jgi:hypothetical protein